MTMSRTTMSTDMKVSMDTRKVSTDTFLTLRLIQVLTASKQTEAELLLSSKKNASTLNGD